MSSPADANVLPPLAGQLPSLPVVHWQAALVTDAECVEVTGSHVGLIFNRKTYRAIAHALAEPEL